MIWAAAADARRPQLARSRPAARPRRKPAA
jgi:hypothetical protein